MTRLTEKVGLRFFLKMGVEDDSLMSLGNLFHSFGPVREKILSRRSRRPVLTEKGLKLHYKYKDKKELINVQK